MDPVAALRSVGPFHVLWVEQEGDHVRRACDWLLALGWKVQQVERLDAAPVDLFAAGFDAVIAPPQLPDGSALQLLPRLHGAPAILAVSLSDRRTAAEALRRGFSRFLVRDDQFEYLHSMAEVLSAAIVAVRTQRRQQRLLTAILAAQRSHIANDDSAGPFQLLLDELLSLTDSGYGFVAEIGQDADGAPLLMPHAVAGTVGDDDPRDLLRRMATGEAALRDLDALFGTALTTGEPVITSDRPADASCGGLRPGQPPLDNFLGMPIAGAGAMVAMVGLADRPGGYTQEDVEFLQPLLNAVGQLVDARRNRAARLDAEARLRETTELLRAQTEVLKLTFESMTQGISSVGPDRRLRAYNRRYQDLLMLPDALVERLPSAEEVAQFQVERGDFGPGFELVEGSARDYLQTEVRMGAFTPKPNAMPAVYLRRTPQGNVLEVRTRYLDGGGWVRTFNDVTEYIEAQDALRRSEERWRDMVALSSDWYWEQDAEFRFTRFDGNLLGRTGSVHAAVTAGRKRWEQRTLNLTEAQWDAHRAVLQAHQPFHDFELHVEVDARLYWIAVSGAPIFDMGGRFTGYRGIGRDITARKAAEAQIERLAFYDELTGLPNRRLLMDRLGRALAASARSQQHGALLFLDLDNFKVLNDTQGHDMGDRLLQQVARRLIECVREVDTVARLGGDEFVVVLESLHAAQPEAAAHAQAVGRKILSALNQPYALDDGAHHSTPSIGIALFNDHQTIEDLLKRGDMAMYQAKEAGRNTLAFFDPDIQRVVSDRSALEADLRGGLQRSELRVYYQAVVDGDHRIVGAEALVRWQHPQRGMVAPGEFIPVAEQSGLILPLGQFVLTTACQQLVAWADRPASAALTMAVNVSAREFRHPDFVQGVVHIIRSAGCNPARLKLELTESLLLNDVEDIIIKMRALKALHVSFALDDFGTGYSSLSYLKRLPLDQLKIDQSFVRDVLTDPNDATIARSIITLAKNLGLGVVAEGVETAAQRDFLFANGCRQFQGYLFGRPGPVEDLRVLIDR